jgi:bacteriorhodopsin
METWFLVGHVVAVAGWLPLLLASPARAQQAVRVARAVAVLLCLAYVAGLALNLGSVPRGGGFTLQSVGRAFAVDELRLVFWIHYLAFDLWVGCWEVEDAAKRAVPRWALLTALLLTFMVGPVGLVAYLGLRAATGRGAAAMNAHAERDCSATSKR